MALCSTPNVKRAPMPAARTSHGCVVPTDTASRKRNVRLSYPNSHGQPLRDALVVPRVMIYTI